VSVVRTMAFATILGNAFTGGSLPAGEPQPQFATLEPKDEQDFFDELEACFESEPIPAKARPKEVTMQEAKVGFSGATGQGPSASRGGRSDALERLLHRRGHPALGGYALDDSALAWNDSAPGLPRASPFVGFRRHAPASPPLHFSPALEPLDLPCLAASQSSASLASLPDDTLSCVFGFAVALGDVASLAACHREAPALLRRPATWAGSIVRIEPKFLATFAPHLSAWLPSWRDVSRLVVPRSEQTLARLAKHAPEVPVDIAWRFDDVLRGSGVEVSGAGTTVRRIGEEELVVIGDAPLSRFGGRAPYFEVLLEDRSEEVGDGLNDFGIGVTVCRPEAEDIGDVADELAESWVVDFTKGSVVLSIDNEHACKSEDLSAEELKEGDRVGIRVLPDSLEVFVNGIARLRFAPEPNQFIELGAELYPVIDMYGRSVQISLCSADASTP